MTYASTDASHDRRRLTGVKHCDHQMPVPQEHDGSAPQPGERDMTCAYVTEFK